MFHESTTTPSHNFSSPSTPQIKHRHPSTSSKMSGRTFHNRNSHSAGRGRRANRAPHNIPRPSAVHRGQPNLRSRRAMTRNAQARLGLLPQQPRQVIQGVVNVYIDWGFRAHLVLDIMVPGQSVTQRSRMADDLRTYGFMDFHVYPTILDFMRSLPKLYVQKDILFFLDYRIFNFLIKAWNKERPHEFDFALLSRIHDALIMRLQTIRCVSRPFRPTIYYRDPDAVTGV